MAKAIQGDLVTGTRLQPLMVTELELQAILFPFFFDDAWARDTVGDLWRQGAPIPNRDPHAEVKRIVFPKQLYKWLEDILNRKGLPLDAQAKTYIELLKVSD